jgi:uncharacterized membrane protein
MVALAVKTLHVMMAAYFLGGGTLIAWFKVRADRSGDPRIVAWTLREVVLADWVFTLPCALLLLASGLTMAIAFEFPIMETEWILAGIFDYTMAGILWVPAVRLQLRMRDLAVEAAEAGAVELPAEYHSATRKWLMLGAPAFLFSLHAFWAMCAKRVFPW